MRRRRKATLHGEKCRGARPDARQVGCQLASSQARRTAGRMPAGQQPAGPASSPFSLHLGRPIGLRSTPDRPAAVWAGIGSGRPPPFKRGSKRASIQHGAPLASFNQRAGLWQARIVAGLGFVLVAAGRVWPRASVCLLGGFFSSLQTETCMQLFC